MKKKSASTHYLFLIFAALFLMIFSAVSLYAGEKTGNGGGGWICEQPSGKILWAQSVDLFEAKSEFGLTLSQFSGWTFEQTSQFERHRGIRAISALYDQAILLPDLQDHFDRLNELKPGTPGIHYVMSDLPAIDDALYFQVPDSSLCSHGRIRYVQIVNYEDDGSVFVNQKYFAVLDSTNKAALVEHEAIYASYRQSHGKSNSVVTRRIVGLIFSNIADSDLIYPIGLALQTGALTPQGNYEVHVVLTHTPQVPTPVAQLKLTFGVSYSSQPDGVYSIFTFDQNTDSNGLIRYQILPELTQPDGTHYKVESLVSICLNFEEGPYCGTVAPLNSSRIYRFRIDNEVAPNPKLNCTETTLAISDGNSIGQIYIVCSENDRFETYQRN